MPKTIRIISRRNQARAGCGAIRTRGAAGVDSGEEIKQYSSKLAIFSFVVMKRPGASSWARERKASSGGVLVDSEAVCRGTWEGKAQRRWKQKPRSRRQLQNRRRKMRSPSKRTEISVLKSSKFARIGTSGEEGVFMRFHPSPRVAWPFGRQIQPKKRPKRRARRPGGNVRRVESRI